MTPAWSAVILTQGTRPRELAAAVESILRQTGVTHEVIVVGNGCTPDDLPEGVRTVTLDVNLGAPEGRNRGVAEADGELFFFLDDDAYLPSSDTLALLTRLFVAAPGLGMVQTRIRTPEGDTLRRWVPRLRDKDPTRGSAVFSVLEGSLAVRGEVLRRSEGWAGPFFYAHEGVELAWRAWDAGYRVEYHPELDAIHPRVEPSRHEDHLWHNARNRVWLAKRNLPFPLAVAYVTLWGALAVIRQGRRPAELGAWLRGAWAGLRNPAGPRRPISWRTVWTMTLHGRPPIV